MTAMKWERSYPWGKALKIEAFEAPGGLKAQVDRIRMAVGPAYGSRNTFAKLFDRESPPTPDHDPIDAVRALLLIDALGLDRTEWGVGGVQLPQAFDPERVLVLVGGDRLGGSKPGGEQTGKKWAAGESNPEPAESMPKAA